MVSVIVSGRQAVCQQPGDEGAWKTSFDYPTVAQKPYRQGREMFVYVTSNEQRKCVLDEGRCV
ncbi:MAG: hypothetical protein M3458_10075 [Acidobacteriota bacterium]|nr:hypothetical protein [Acidobacteriota bacterium]